MTNQNYNIITIKKKLKLPTRQIYQKHPKFIVFTNGFPTETKSVNKLVIGKFIDKFLSLLIITNRFIRR